MITACPTVQHIHAMARSAAHLGSPTCETEIDGVRVTVHAKHFSAPNDRLPHQKKTVLDASASASRERGEGGTDHERDADTFQ